MVKISNVEYDLTDEVSRRRCENAIYKKYKPIIKRFFLKRIFDRDIVNTLTLRTLNSVLLSLDKYDTSKPIINWISGFTRNNYMLHLTESKRNKVVFNRDGIDYCDNDYFEELDYYEDTDNLIIGKHHYTNIENYVTDNITKQVLLLRLDGFKYDEISEMIGKRKATIYKHLEKDVDVIKRCFIEQ